MTPFSLLNFFSFYVNCIVGVITSVLTSDVTGRDLGSCTGRVKPQTTELVFVASPLSPKH